MLAYVSKLVPILCLLLLMQACNIDKTEAPVLDTEVEKEYELDLWENLINNNRTLELRVNTIKSLECSNYFIENTSSRKGNSIEINLGKPQIPGPCAPGTGVAKSNLNLGSISNGTYTFTIKLGKIVPSTGRLIVSNGSYFLSMPTPIGFRILHNNLLRVPDNTIWGYIAYDPSISTTAAQFLRELVNVSQTPDLAKGYYGYFNLLESGEMELGGGKVATDLPVQPILRRFQVDDKELEKLVQTYREKYGQALQIHLRNTGGKEY